MGRFQVPAGDSTGADRRCSSSTTTYENQQHHRQLVGLLAACWRCAAPSAAGPTAWDQDVFPILQGSCNHCHGETVGHRPCRLTPLSTSATHGAFSSDAVFP